MAVYKVIQDIESEDKLLGPLTLKGFIYAAIAGLLAFINFRLLISSNLGLLRWPFILMFLLPMILFGVLASPLGREQPTEVWLLSRIQFLIRPRRRVWNQSGIRHLVTITAPKRVERHLTKEFNQIEVNSRLKALATTLDSRGWAVKNVNVNLSAGPGYLEDTRDGPDRLVSASSLPQDTQALDVHAADDILDEQNNPTAQKFKQLMEQAEDSRKEDVKARMKTATDSNEKVVDSNKKDPEPEAPLKEAGKPFESQFPPVTASNDAAKLELAQSGSDLSVASIAHLANRKFGVRQVGPNEVEISLH